MKKKTPLRRISYGTTTVSGKIWQDLDLKPKPKLWTKMDSEPEINNFGSAKLKKIHGMRG